MFQTQNFQIFEEKNYDMLSLRAAKYICRLIKENPEAVIICATGSTPTRMYADLARLVEEERVDCSKVTIVKLDEWVGLLPSDPSTCEFYIKQHVLEPLGIPESNYISFQSNTPDPQNECERIDTILHNLGNEPDLCILGLGANGHLGMNEPGTDPESHTHVATLTSQTRAHTMLSGNTQTVTRGMTLGIQDILQTKTAMLLVSGAQKKAQFERFMRKEDGSNFPASYLWDHKNVSCFVDEEAYHTSS